MVNYINRPSVRKFWECYVLVSTLHEQGGISLPAHSLWQLWGSHHCHVPNLCQPPHFEHAVSAPVLIRLIKPCFPQRVVPSWVICLWQTVLMVCFPVPGMFNRSSKSNVVINDKMETTTNLKMGYSTHVKTLHYNSLTSKCCISMDLHTQHLQHEQVLFINKSGKEIGCPN